MKDLKIFSFYVKLSDIRESTNKKNMYSLDLTRTGFDEEKEFGAYQNLYKKYFHYISLQPLVLILCNCSKMQDTVYYDNSRA